MIVAYLLFQPSMLAQPAVDIRVLIAVADRAQGPVPLDFDVTTKQLLEKLGFRSDDRPRFRTCEARPRTVVAGRIPPAGIDAFHDLLRDKDRPAPIQLYDNPIVLPQYPTAYADICPRPADLGLDQVRRKAGLDAAGLEHGSGAVVAIVDRGVDMTAITNRFPKVKHNTTFSWPPNSTTIFGDHGTKCAFAAAMAAPAVEIADIRTFGDAGGFAAAYEHLRTTWIANKSKWKGLVVSTSWEFPRADPNSKFRPEETLALSTTHVLSTEIRCLADSGVDVVFAAGNGGSCAVSTRIMNGSIRPPNSMPETITIAAVDGLNARLGDSGQGGLAAPTKPDFSAFGSLVVQEFPPLRHTSIATAFAAGMTASLRSLAGWSANDRTTGQVRKCFADHADKSVQVVSQSGTLSNVQLTTHSNDFGYGVMRFESVHTWKDECGKVPTP